MNASIVRAMLVAWSLHNNGDAAIVYKCIADCGKAHGGEVILAEPDERRVRVRRRTVARLRVVSAQIRQGRVGLRHTRGRAYGRAMRTLDDWILYTSAAILALAMLGSSAEGCLGPPTRALSQSIPRLAPRLVLARMCAHEASLPVGLDEDGDGEIDRWVTHRDHEQTWGDDCYLIHAVLLRGAERMRAQHPRMRLAEAYERYAILYSHGRFLRPPVADGNRWAFDLHPDGHEPAGWHGMPWASARAAWLHAYEHAGEVSSLGLDELDARWHCDEPVTDWGGRMDHSHAQVIGLVPVRCDGYLVNTAYVRPGLR